MTNLADLVQFEDPGSALSFRARAYGKGEEAELLCDVIALANAEAEGPRFLCLGVSDKADCEREFPGIPPKLWARIKQVLPRLLERVIEPQLAVTLRELTMGDSLVGVLCLDRCDDQPYLFSRHVSDAIRAGSGWIRRDTKQRPLLRKDFVRMFEAKYRTSDTAKDVRVAFPGRVPTEDLTLPVLPLDALPSALAAQRLLKMLDAKQLSKRMLGRTDTRIARLVHAQGAEAEAAYRSYGATTLVQRLRQSPQEHEEADAHYQFDTRAHKVSFLIVNATDAVLSNVVLTVKIPRMEGVVIADRVFAAPGEKAPPPGRYPLIDSGPRATSIQVSGISVPRRSSVDALPEALRVCLREPAAGKTIALTYSLQGRGLGAPVHGGLRIHVAAAEAVPAGAPAKG